MRIAYIPGDYQRVLIKAGDVEAEAESKEDGEESERALSEDGKVWTLSVRDINLLSIGVQQVGEQLHVVVGVKPTRHVGDVVEGGALAARAC